jgi:hypothetical protein
MIQRIQTIFWILSIVFICLFLGQTFDLEQGFKIFQEPKFSIFSTLSIILNFAAIFTFKKRKRQIFFSTLSLILLLIQILMLFYKEQLHFLDIYLKAFIFLVIGILSNALGGFYTKQDLKLLENSSRLR